MEVYLPIVKFSQKSGPITTPIHDWYQQKHHGAALELKGDKKLETTITRFISGHTRTLSYVQGQKVFSCVPQVQYTPIHSRPSALMCGTGEEEPV
ncbi:hypothetical protein AVEN_180071-1 [Araneus ventricosus]|uniref:Uncharacterized protein n=1 Tax=Araneus ventricosus TaxID=182803 RepID=A0A4Y2WCD0_ARAVE|nr:hypothetical protein AVEN_180071-1 [Araneus ventricosus]